MSSLLFRKLAIFLLVSVFFVGCDRKIEIKTGDFLGLHIGMTKAEVRHKLLELGVVSVEPVVNSNLNIDRGSIEKLVLLNSEVAPGICLEDGPGFSLHVAFDADGRSKITYKSAMVDLPSNGFSESQNRQEVLLTIKKLFGNHLW